MLRRILIAAVIVLAMLYLADSLRLRLALREPLGTIIVHRFDAIPQKNGKVEYAYEPPVAETCVHSLFPHQGHPPCWYLARHAEQRVQY